MRLATALHPAPLLCALVACSEPAPEPPAKSPPERLYGQILATCMEHGLPGFALAVDRLGEPLWTGTAGYADVVAGRDLEVDDPFHLASVTKAITAAATLRLVDRGELALEDRVIDLLDSSTTAGLPAIDRITVRHLLEHSSGLYSFNNDRAYWRRLIGADAYSGLEWTTDELLDFVREQPPSGEPGSGFYYADTNYLLLGEVLAAVAGTDFKSVVRREVFEPLGMSSAYFYSDYRSGAAQPRRPPVEGYLVLSDVIETFGLHPDLPRIDDGTLEATRAHERSDTAAGIVASAPDMARFARALFDGDFLSPAAHELLREPLDRLGETGEAGGALRAYAKPYGAILTAEGDGPGGVHTLLAHHPESDTVVVAFTNVFGRWDEMDFLLDEVLATILR